MADELETTLDDLNQGKNTGVVVKVRPLDWALGGETGITYVERLENGDWEKYISGGEWQRRNVSGKLGYDTNSCVTFSGLNIIEMQINWMRSQDMIPADVLVQMEDLGWFDDDGNANFSEWFSANTNGTTVDGNDLGSFWDGVRRDGLLGQKWGFAPNDFSSIDDWFDKSKITDEMRAKAKKALDLISINYEWSVLGVQGQWSTFAREVKHAPLHIATPTCYGWNGEQGPIVPVCQGVTRLNHATSYIGQKAGVYHKDLDHYVPFVKELNWNYYIPYAIKGVVSLKQAPAPAPKFHYTFSMQLTYGDPKNPTAEVQKLQQALQFLGYMTKGVFGPFGPQTRKALGAFQTAQGIKDPDGQGANFGPQTRAALNKVLNG